MDFRPMNEPEIRSWYSQELTKTFPSHERKPLTHILDLKAAGNYTLLGLYDGASLLGYASLHSHPDFPQYILLDYLGVTAVRRSGGLGSHILTLLEERFHEKACLIIEAESPVPGGDEAENSLRRRRIGFYERCGCRRVYETGVCGIRCQVLALGETGDLTALAEAHRAIYGPGRPDITIPLGADESPAPACWSGES